MDWETIALTSLTAGVGGCAALATKRPCVYQRLTLPVFWIINVAAFCALGAAWAAAVGVEVVRAVFGDSTGSAVQSCITAALFLIGLNAAHALLAALAHRVESAREVDAARSRERACHAAQDGFHPPPDSESTS